MVLCRWIARAAAVLLIVLAVAVAPAGTARAEIEIPPWILMFLLCEGDPDTPDLNDIQKPGTSPDTQSGGDSQTGTVPISDIVTTTIETWLRTF
jgi:hypothetical protein